MQLSIHEGMYGVIQVIITRCFQNCSSCRARIIHQETFVQLLKHDQDMKFHLKLLDDFRKRGKLDRLL